MNLEKVGKGIGVALVTTSILVSMTGCAKKVNCDIVGSHAHLYVDSDGNQRYIQQEYERYKGYDRLDNYIDITNQEEIYEFLDDKNLLSIEDNYENIVKQQEENQDYIEYRYKYLFMQPIPRVVVVGKNTMTQFSYIPTYRYSWTTDSKKAGKTGEERVCHYVYYAYKIEKNDNGKYVAVKSPEVDDITTIMNEYPYIKKKFFKTVDIYGKELDYEDGREEDLSDEERKRIEEYEETNEVETILDDSKTLVKQK